jgi:uncharacterized protein (TIGR01777 family)
MVISISGAGGMIGQALTRVFTEKGWTIRIINRDSFNLSDEAFRLQKIEGTDAVINLAGAPLSAKWTDLYMKEIYNSRILTTRKITQSIVNATQRPSLFISASAIGIYDPIGIHTEESTAFSSGFIYQLCMDWEAEAFKASGITRLVIMRMGVVLSAEGGALKKMVLPFSLGLGGKVGEGSQPFSFIHIDDLVQAFIFIIGFPEMTGVVNAVTPYPTTQSEFAQKFGRVLKQPVFLTIPEFVLRCRLGKGASMLLEGQRVMPGKLEKAGFRWKYPTVQNALVNLYG